MDKYKACCKLAKKPVTIQEVIERGVIGSLASTDPYINDVLGETFDKSLNDELTNFDLLSGPERTKLFEESIRDWLINAPTQWKNTNKYKK